MTGVQTCALPICTELEYAKLDKYGPKRLAKLVQDTVEKNRKMLAYKQQIATKSTLNHLEMAKEKLLGIGTQLHALSPLNIMQRGYSVVTKEEMIVHSVLQVANDDLLTIRLSDGTLKARVEELGGYDGETVNL